LRTQEWDDGCDGSADGSCYEGVFDGGQVISESFDHDCDGHVDECLTNYDTECQENEAASLTMRQPRMPAHAPIHRPGIEEAIPTGRLATAAEGVTPRR